MQASVKPEAWEQTARAACMSASCFQVQAEPNYHSVSHLNTASQHVTTRSMTTQAATPHCAQRQAIVQPSGGQRNVLASDTFGTVPKVQCSDHSKARQSARAATKAHCRCGCTTPCVSQLALTTDTQRNPQQQSCKRPTGLAASLTSGG